MPHTGLEDGITSFGYVELHWSFFLPVLFLSLRCCNRCSWQNMISENSSAHLQVILLVNPILRFNSPQSSSSGHHSRSRCPSCRCSLESLCSRRGLWSQPGKSSTTNNIMHIISTIIMAKIRPKKWASQCKPCLHKWSKSSNDSIGLSKIRINEVLHNISFSSGCNYWNSWAPPKVWPWNSLNNYRLYLVNCMHTSKVNIWELSTNLCYLCDLTQSYQVSHQNNEIRGNYGRTKSISTHPCVIPPLDDASHHSFAKPLETI